MVEHLPASGRKEPAEALDALAHAVIGAAIEVHRILGPGYVESIYEQALAVELGIRGVRYERQKPFEVMFKGSTVGEGRLDFLVESCLVVELKAVERLMPVHKAQVISYLKAVSCELGLLLNFNENLLRRGTQRIILSQTET